MNESNTESDRRAMTIAEKILGEHAGEEVRAGDIVIADLDKMMFHDGTFNLVLQAWERMGEEELADAEKVILIVDHSAPPPNEGAANLHSRMRKFAAEQGVKMYDVGEGICHQIMPEQGHALPGDLIIGADSHTVTYGGINAFSTGVGATDLAAGLVSGKLWFRVPQTIRVDLEGELAEGVFSKDLILWLAGELGADGATYKALEFGGEGLSSLSVEARLTVSNMAIELGGKAGLMEPDSFVLDWLKGRAEDGRRPRPVYPDEGAVYESELTVNLADLVPVVAAPHEVDNVYPVTELAGKAIDQAVIGTCTNGRLEDLRTAADLLEGSRVDPGVRLIVAPASRAIYREASEEGTLGKLVQAGGTVIPPGCGPCLGTHNGIPGDGENVISTANRNFKGRMGNESSFVHLASPATVAASAIEGEITDPRNWL